jgi:hypothetical protein
MVAYDSYSRITHPWLYKTKAEFKKKKEGKYILPNYQMPQGCRSGEYQFWKWTDDSQEPYHIFKQRILGQIRLIRQFTQYDGMIVNKEGHPKTNTTEPRAKLLCRMLKEGIIQMETRQSHSWRSKSSHRYSILTIKE